MQVLGYDVNLAKRVTELEAAVNLVPRRVEFVAATRQDTLQLDLRITHRPVNVEPAFEHAVKSHVSRVHPNGKEASELQLPSYELFPEARLPQLMVWGNVRGVGSGLINMGNTCFLNAVLQCLTYTTPLANYALQREHSRTCRTTGFCMFCVVEQHITRVLGSKTPLAPKNIVGNLKYIAKHLRLGRQEDSHEFLRYVTETLQNSCTQHMKKKIEATDRRIAYTSIVHRVFGGYLRSQVKCCECGHASNTYDPFLDLSLEIRGETLDRSLQHFCKTEVLDERNKYKCERCHKPVRATKQLSVHQAPAILVIQLKRFSYMSFHGGGKINRPVSFTEKLKLSPFLSKGQVDRGGYTLFAVLVHSGGSTHSGHYYCFIKADNGIWYCMDDSHVQQVSLSTVLQQQAYILFYQRQSKQQPVVTSTSSIPDTHSPTPTSTPTPTPTSLTHVQAPVLAQTNPLTQNGHVHDKSISGVKRTPLLPTMDNPTKRQKTDTLNGSVNATHTVLASSFVSGRESVSSLTTALIPQPHHDDKENGHFQPLSPTSPLTSTPITSLTSSHIPVIEWDSNTQRTRTEVTPNSVVTDWNGNKEQKKRARILHQLLQHGHNGVWQEDSVASKQHEKLSQLAAREERTQEGLGKAKDTWDMEYDRGKQKKVKVTREDQEGNNRFQQLLESRRSKPRQEQSFVKGAKRHRKGWNHKIVQRASQRRGGPRGGPRRPQPHRQRVRTRPRV